MVESSSNVMTHGDAREGQFEKSLCTFNTFYKVLEVKSTSVYTGLNLFNFIRKHFLQIFLCLSGQQLSERTVLCENLLPHLTDLGLLLICVSQCHALESPF